MEGSRGRWRWGGRRRSVLMVALALFFVVAVASLCCCCCARPGACSASGCSWRSTVVVLPSDFWRRAAASFGNQDRPRASGSGRRRRLTLEGPGSYPPRCASKCGGCNPCYPVHVAVPPGVPVTTEYYPEAWRCRCGNRLYMP